MDVEFYEQLQKRRKESPKTHKSVSRQSHP